MISWKLQVDKCICNLIFTSHDTFKKKSLCCLVHAFVQVRYSELIHGSKLSFMSCHKRLKLCNNLTLLVVPQPFKAWIVECKCIRLMGRFWTTMKPNFFLPIIRPVTEVVHITSQYIDNFGIITFHSMIKMIHYDRNNIQDLEH